MYKKVAKISSHDTMEIHWRKDKLKSTVEAMAASNPITARRMNSIKAASDFRDLVPESNGRAHFLKREMKSYFSLDLERKGNGKRLICIPTGNFEVKNNMYVLESIKEFEVVSIEDTHKNKRW